jgi:hypothetical protein
VEAEGLEQQLEAAAEQLIHLEDGAVQLARAERELEAAVEALRAAERQVREWERERVEEQVREWESERVEEQVREWRSR